MALPESCRDERMIYIYTRTWGDGQGKKVPKRREYMRSKAPSKRKGKEASGHLYAPSYFEFWVAGVSIGYRLCDVVYK